MAARSDSETGAAWCGRRNSSRRSTMRTSASGRFATRAIEFEQLIFSGARVVVGLKRRRGRTQQRDGAFQARAIHGRVAAVVTRSFLLLVAGFLLFVHDDEAEIFERREDRGARADHHARFAVAHAPPFARAFDIGQPLCSMATLFAEARAHQPPDPQRERDFRDKHDCRFAARERRFDRAKIDFRLAAAGDAVQQALP